MPGKSMNKALHTEVFFSFVNFSPSLPVIQIFLSAIIMEENLIGWEELTRTRPLGEQEQDAKFNGTKIVGSRLSMLKNDKN